MMTSQLLHDMPPVKAVEDDVRQYLSEIREFPRLSPEQERQLAQRCAVGDEDAIRQMVNCNLRLVVSIAREYAGRGVPLLDLIQEGSIGLLAAAKKFDHTLDFRFSTYATKWIRQGVSKCVVDHGSVIRVPAYTAERLRKIRAARSRFVTENGTEPTPEQLALACDLTADKIRKLLLMEPEICSLDAAIGDDDSTLGQLIEDIHASQPYDKLVRDELNQTMERLLGALDERQRQILRLRFGMEDGERHSLEQVSKKLSITKERARQLEHQAMDKLRKIGAEMGLEDFLE